MKNIGRMLAAIIASVMLTGSLSACEETDTMETEIESAYQSVENMVVGWNLGNSLDSCGDWISGDAISYETAWGNPETTAELISAVKECGFGAVRVPVTWKEHIDPETYEIDSEWLDRVEEVVNLVLDEDMYCIINLHHDTGGDGWCRASKESYEEYSEQYAEIWRQIAERFIDYGEKLLFEGFNEILDENNSWTTTDSESYEALNSYNQLFVDTVRATGGSNSERNLIVSTYACNCQEKNLENFIVPTDSTQGHIILQIHIYDPSWFTSNGGKTPERDWGTDSDKAELDTLFDRILSYSSEWDVPVIIGEFGAQEMLGNNENRAEYAYYFVSAAKERGFTSFWWDDGGYMEILDRKAAKPSASAIVSAIVEGAGVDA